VTLIGIAHVLEDDLGFGIRRSDSDDRDDPHKALGNIVLDDFLDTPSTKEKSSKKKSKLDNLTVSPELTVEHKTHKKKKKEKKKKSSHTKDVDLLGLDQPVSTAGGEDKNVPCSTGQWDWSNEILSLSLDLASCRVEAVEEDVFALSCHLSVTNTGPNKLSGLRVAASATAGKTSSLSKSLKPGATKSKVVSLALVVGKEANVEICLSWEGGNQELLTMPLPPHACLAYPPAQCDEEQYAELLLSGELTHSTARQLNLSSKPFHAFAQDLALKLNVGLVRVQEASASFYNSPVGGGKLAFLLKAGPEGVGTFEGRCLEEDRELLGRILDCSLQTSE